MSKSKSDNTLMLLVRGGEIKQVGILFERYHVKLYNYLLRLTQDVALSEDLLQETFVNVIKYRHTFRDDSTFAPWLFNIARNLCYAQFRKDKPLMVSADLLTETEDESADTFAHLEKTYDTSLLMRALEKLPLMYREILVLSKFHELKYEDISEILDCSVNTVKVRVHRAIKELQKQYFSLASSSNYGT